MENKFTLITFGIFLSFLSCGQSNEDKEIGEGSVQGNIYSSKEIGWTIQIPDGWDVISKDKLERNTDKGLEAMEEVAGDIDYSGLKHLISFKKNQFNIFLSSSEPFILEYEGEWEDNNAGLKDLLYETYTSRGIKIDTASSKASIDGIDFEVFHIIMYNPDGDVILYQDMYSSYINGFDFGVNLNYNNDRDKETLMTALRNSKFKK